MTGLNFECINLPASFQIMAIIEERAQETVKTILKDVAEGKTTLAEVKRSRGIVK
ncbi:MAG: hypothetical protein JXA38_05150 [Methanosarcinaceae archaeon]|nr:hypothetical protein [Methanosarcinaceae archaeon]